MPLGKGMRHSATEGGMTVAPVEQEGWGWAWEGGRPCIDLVNTVRNRVVAPADTLNCAGDVSDWLVRARLLADKQCPRRKVPGREGDRLLEDARELRAAVEAVLTGPPVPVEAVATVERWAGRAPRDRLVRDDDGAVRVMSSAPPAQDARAALGLVAADLVDLVRGGGLASVKTCAHERCGLRFEDRTPRGARRWCSMRRCGNRAKVSRHAERARTKSAGEAGAHRV